ncbi:MAG: hypothetical protein WAW80_04360 [Candidatus Saccharimonadales bacterium]
MPINKHELRRNIEQRIPTTGMVDDIATQELDVYIKGAEEASLIAHAKFCEDFADNDPQIIGFNGDNDEKDKYLSYAGHEGVPLFGPWDPKRPSTDVGFRSVNPYYSGIANPTTIVHADSMATKDFVERGAPEHVVDAIDAVARLNNYVENTLAKPFLHQVAEAFGVNPDTYLANYFATERGRREQILTRVIMYHLEAAPGQRPIGSDGEPLLITEHVDRSAWTIDLHQTSPGLQHYFNGQWHDASTEITAFRGASDSYLPGPKLPATLHRAIERQRTPDNYLSNVGIGRIAVPMFIAPIHDNARIVRPGSAETHPTQR